jgi:hypothetical protein
MRAPSLSIRNLRELLPLLLYSAGIFTVTWDMLGRYEISGFHFKIHQGMFLLAFLTALPGTDFAGLWQKLRSSPLLGFPLGILALDVFYLLATPWSHFPLKTVLYGCWLGYNLITIWGTAILLYGRGQGEKLHLVAWAAAAFNGSVILIDYIAYNFGFNGGLVGFNQDAVLHWGVSRPHAFSNEPSFAALYLGIALALTTFPFVEARNWKRLALSFIVLFVGTLLLSFFYALAWRRLPWRYLGISFVSGLLAAVLVYSTTPQQQRDVLNQKLVSSVTEVTDNSGKARLRAFIYAWQMANETHWLGTGFGASYKYWIARPETLGDKHEFSTWEHDYGAQVVMSTWGELLAEGGLMAPLLYGIAVFSLVWALWKNWILSRSPLSLGALSSALLFFGYLALWVGNVARGDVWIWYAIWSVLAIQGGAEDADRRIVSSAP